jgi:hypothetical protein
MPWRSTLHLFTPNDLAMDVLQEGIFMLEDFDQVRSARKQFSVMSKPVILYAFLRLGSDARISSLL